MIPKNLGRYQKKYDEDHDVLHVFFPPFAPSFDDEEYPGVIIKRSAIDERITGITILDFKKNKEIAKKILPQFDFIF